MNILEKIGYWVGNFLLAVILSSLWEDASLIILVVVFAVAIIRKDKVFFNRELKNREKKEKKEREKELKKRSSPTDRRKFSVRKHWFSVKKVIAWILILLVAALIVGFIEDARKPVGYMSHEDAAGHAKGTGVLVAIVYGTAFFICYAVGKRLDRSKALKDARQKIEMERKEEEKAKLEAMKSHDELQ